jgi:ArsR family transcriptional regulator
MVGMPMDEKRPDIVELVAVLKALSDPTRLVILDLLMQGVQCNCYLGDRLGLPMNLISHHLKVLRQAGLVKAERDPLDARWIYYSLDQEKLAGLREQLSAFLDPRRIQLRLPTCGPQFAGKETAHVTR